MSNPEDQKIPISTTTGDPYRNCICVFPERYIRLTGSSSVAFSPGTVQVFFLFLSAARDYQRCLCPPGSLRVASSLLCASTLHSRRIKGFSAGLTLTQPANPGRHLKLGPQKKTTPARPEAAKKLSKKRGKENSRLDTDLRLSKSSTPILPFTHIVSSARPRPLTLVCGRSHKFFSGRVRSVQFISLID